MAWGEIPAATARPLAIQPPAALFPPAAALFLPVATPSPPVAVSPSAVFRAGPGFIGTPGFSKIFALPLSGMSFFNLTSQTGAPMRSWMLAILLLAGILVLPGAEGPQGTAAVPVQIKRVLLIGDSPAVLLMDEPGQRYLLVFIDFFMANAIRMGMEGPRHPRPLTHDLIGILLQRLGAKVSKIAITELRENTYYALITLDVNGRKVEIDARPSDALAIAVRLKSPVFASPALLKSLHQPGTAPEGEIPHHAPFPVPGKRTTT